MTACLLHYFVIRLSANDEVNGGVALFVNAELVVLAGQDRVYCDADEGCYCEAGEGYDADLDAADGVVYADREDEDKCCDDNVAAVGEVNLVLNDVADADCGDHTVEDEGYAADGCGGHCGDEGCKLRAEGEHYCKACCDADHAGVIDLAECENAGVFTVGGVCRCAEESCQGGCKTVAEEGAVQAGVSNIVLADGGGYGAYVADVLDHGCKRQRNDGEYCAQEHAGVNIHVEEVEYGPVPIDGKAKHISRCDGLNDFCTGCRVKDHGDDIRAEDAEEDGDDLGHALAPDVEADNDDYCGNGDEPVCVAVADR